jgi:hypothetical protein
MCFSAGSAISLSWEDEENNLRIWDLSNGTCRHSIEVDSGLNKHAASNEEVFVPNFGEEDGTIDAINIHTGVIRSIPRLAWIAEDGIVNKLHLCGDFLLAAVPIFALTCEDEADETYKEEAIRRAGFYIFDRSSLELVNHIAGTYLCIKSAANGDVVAEKADGRTYGRIDVFHLDDDRLIFRTSFQRRCLTPIDQNHQSIFLVHNSKAYVHPDGLATCTEVYNILTGDLERTLYHPPRGRDGTNFLHCLVAGKKELFCGFHVGDGMNSSNRNATSAIKVYLLD